MPAVGYSSPMTAPIIAADVGGTNLRAAIVYEGGTISHRTQRPTPAAEGPDAIVAAIAGLLRDVRDAAGFACAAVSIGMAGLINGEKGVVLISPNIPGFRNVAVAGPVAAAVGLPVFIENDASAAALGEYRFGAGRGTRHLLHATLGTGVGGGLVINGKLYHGATGLAGEIGHLIMDPAGPRCNCGSRGCLEAMVSGTAFAARARKLLATNASPILAGIVGDREPAGIDLFRAAEAGDAVSEAEIRHGGHVLGLAFGSLVNVLNPDAITLSGGLLALGDMLFGPMRDAFYSIAYGPASGTAIRLSELGEDAGLLGAAAVGFEQLGG